MAVGAGNVAVFGRAARRGGGVSLDRAEAEGGQAQMVAGSLIRRPLDKPIFGVILSFAV